jgi:hypothetical protein
MTHKFPIPQPLEDYKDWLSESEIKNDRCPVCERKFGSLIGVKTHISRTHNIQVRVERMCKNCCVKYGYKRSGENIPDEIKYCTNCKPEKFIECKVCNRMLNSISNTHIKKHNMTVGEYKNKFNEKVRGDGLIQRKSKYKLEHHKCMNCGTGFSKRGPDANKYCSRKCYYKAKSDNVKGENNPNYKEGYEPNYDYGDNWYQMRRKTLDRDNRRCIICKESESNLERGLEVHHINPIRSFEIPEKANTLDNLVTLCKNCHIEVENNNKGNEIVFNAIAKDAHKQVLRGMI